MIRNFLIAQARRMALFQAMRLLDQPDGGLRRGRRIRLRHVAHMHHPDCDLESVEADGDALILNSHVLGLLGASGPMPLRLVEEAVWQMRQDRAAPLSEFLAFLGERHMLWFYDAWTQGRAEHGSTRGDGLLQEAASCLGGGARIDRNDLGLLGLLMHAPRGSAALKSLIAAFTGCATSLTQFVGAWLHIETADRCTIGRAVLGAKATIGSRVWQRVGTFQVGLRMRNYEEYISFIPKRNAQAEALDQLISRFLVIGLKWRCALTLASQDVRPMRLGVLGALGETAWVGRPETPDATVSFASPSSRFTTTRATK